MLDHIEKFKVAILHKRLESLTTTKGVLSLFHGGPLIIDIGNR